MHSTRVRKPVARSTSCSATTGDGYAIGVAVVLQVAVVHLPFLQAAFKTEALTLTEWIVSIAGHGNGMRCG